MLPAPTTIRLCRGIFLLGWAGRLRVDDLIVFSASANSFVAEDTNGVCDIFVKDMSYPLDIKQRT